MGNLIIIDAGLARLSAAITEGRMGIKCILISEQVLKIPEIYHEPSCWQLLYHHYRSDEERWAYMARSGCVMLDLPVGQTYVDLHTLIKGGCKQCMN